MCDISMLQCECEKLQHERFDNISNQELCQKITIQDVFNESYCVMVPIGHIDEKEHLSIHEVLIDLKGKVGVYGLWLNHTYCYEHDMHRMFCLYTGKGSALGRVKKHIQEKWPEDELLYVTFYECKNRIAKYIEQLLLDSYNFPINSAENKGEGYLFSKWTDERFTLGTHTHEISSRLADKFPDEFQ